MLEKLSDQAIFYQIWCNTTTNIAWNSTQRHDTATSHFNFNSIQYIAPLFNTTYPGSTAISLPSKQSFLLSSPWCQCTYCGQFCLLTGPGHRNGKISAVHSAGRQTTASYNTQYLLSLREFCSLNTIIIQTWPGFLFTGNK